MLFVAALLIALTALVHSYLGERYILMRLFRRPLPKLFGSDEFTKQTLRFVWHLTSIAWLCLAALLLLIALGMFSESMVLRVIGGSFAVATLFPLLSTRGRHLSWLVFAAVSILCFMAVSS